MSELDTNKTELSEFIKINDRHVHVGITSENGLHKLYIDGSEVDPLEFLLETGVLHNAHDPYILETAKLAKMGRIAGNSITAQLAQIICGEDSIRLTGESHHRSVYDTNYTQPTEPFPE